MLPDYLEPNLSVVFVGTSVAHASVKRGHYYAGPGNKFYEFLWEADLTGERVLLPEQDVTLASLGVGLTDLVKGVAASSDSALRPGDYDVAGFLQKIEGFEPLVVAFNGKGAAACVARALRQGEATLGLAPWKIGGSHVYVLPSSSGSSADPRDYAPKSSKAEWWREFGSWLRRAHAERY